MKLETGDSPHVDPPSPWVVRHAGKIAPGGRVLDLACGTGRHARWLAGNGFSVLAVDRDQEALDGLTAMNGIATVEFDLETGAWLPGEQEFSAIVVSRYLHRPLLPHIAKALAPGGVLIYETFMRGNERYGRPSRDEFLLQPGELRSFAASFGLVLLDYREGFEAVPRPAVTQSICARRD